MTAGAGPRSLWPGRPWPLGATWDGEGLNFAVASGTAEGVDLCLFDAPQGPEVARLALPERTQDTWHGYLPGGRPGQLYGYRTRGVHDPRRGLWHHPAWLLADPCAQAYSGSIRWHEGLGAGAPPDGDTAPFVPRSRACDPSFDWEDDRPPHAPWSRTLVYECHVRNLTRLHPGVPEALRGTYLGLASPAVVDHLLGLGVTAVELMPVAHHVPERHLLETGRPNGWGYSPLGFQAPHAGYATGDDGRQVREMKAMVKALHRAGLEVILDVCMGHLAEGGSDGLVLSLRGLDPAATWRRADGRDVDWTGCGATVDASHPRTLRLVMDALRTWVRDFHVDGFRFDQAVVLGRDRDGAYREDSPFHAAVAQDPSLAGVKLVAEPWDVGPGGYRLGGFPAGWAEWNDRFRDDVRMFWRGDEGKLGPLASRLAGSSDVFTGGRRGPGASVNYVASHDGLTLADSTSHATRHNEANGEANRDGHPGEVSASWGPEGDTTDGRVRRRRARIRRAMLATLALSQGIPMLASGDEMGRTQAGNNNAYCHDSALVWVDWALDREQEDLLAFARRALAVRRAHPVLRRRAFFHGRAVAREGDLDVTWLRPDGGEMSEPDWHEAGARAVAMVLSRGAADWVDERGQPVTGPPLLLLVNGGARRERFRLPASRPGETWREILHTARTRLRAATGSAHPVPPRSLVLLEAASSTEGRS